MLDVLGLGTEAEAVYRAMLSYPREGVLQLAARLRFTEQQVRDGLDRLSELALVQSSPGEGIGFRAASPEAAMEILLARQQAELAAQQMHMEASRAAAAQLIAECSAPRPRIADHDSEQLIGPDAIRERLATLADVAQKEIVTFAPGGAHTEEDLGSQPQPDSFFSSPGSAQGTFASRTAGPCIHICRIHEPTDLPAPGHQYQHCRDIPEQGADQARCPYPSPPGQSRSQSRSLIASQS